jgi:tetratricopeptide (TPR) repeat protein
MATFSILASGGCNKPAPVVPGRPDGDVCAGLANLPPCDKAPEGNVPQGIDLASNCYDVGQQQFNCGLFDAASVSLTRSANLKSDPRTWHALGESYLLQEKWSNAIEAYNHAIEADSKRRNTFLRLGMAYMMSKQYELAHQAYTKARALDPQKFDAIRGDVETWIDEGKYDQAAEELKAVDGQGDTANQIAVLDMERQVLELKYRQAKKSGAPDALTASAAALSDVLARMIKLKPQPPATYRELAEACLDAGDLEAAEFVFDQLTQLDPKDFVSPRMAGMLKEQHGDNAGAEKALTASITIQPKQSLAYLALGRVALAAKDHAKATQNFNLALQNEDGKDANEVVQLAQLASQLGSLDKAEGLYESLDEDPELSKKPELWLAQAQASASMKHDDKVKNACARAKSAGSNAPCPPPPDAPALVIPVASAIPSVTPLPKDAQVPIAPVTPKAYTGPPPQKSKPH